MEDGEVLGDNVKLETFTENHQLIESNLEVAELNIVANKEELAGNKINNNVEPFEGELVESDSGFQSSRAESVNETVKKRIYKQAIDINQKILINSKHQRLHEGVSRVFGVDDPPPGFGLIYPKYYYLEQKRPLPMSPLKVWRGFNGNIYFEPIHLKNLNSSSSNDNLKQPTMTQNRSDPQTYLKPAQLKQIDETHRQNLQHFFDLKISTKTSKPHVDLKRSVDNYVDLFNHRERKAKNDEEEENNVNNHNLNMSETSSMIDFKKISLITTTMKKPTKIAEIPANNIEVKKISKPVKIKTLNESAKAIILPNLSAVKKMNSPLKGLAYKEAKMRIVHNSSDEYLLFENNNNNNNNEFLKKSSEIFIKEQNLENNNFLNNNHNTNKTEENSSHLPPRQNYKEMLRGIRKGVTLNQRFVDDLDKRNSAAEATTQGANRVMVRKNMKKNLKILKIKGDRIAGSIELTSKSADCGSKANRRMNVKSNFFLDTSFKTRLLSTSMHSLRSVTSTQSLANRRIHPTPDITH